MSQLKKGIFSIALLGTSPNLLELPVVQHPLETACNKKKPLLNKDF